MDLHPTEHSWSQQSSGCPITHRFLHLELQLILLSGKWNFIHSSIHPFNRLFVRLLIHSFRCRFRSNLFHSFSVLMRFMGIIFTLFMNWLSNRMIYYVLTFFKLPIIDLINYLLTYHMLIKNSIKLSWSLTSLTHFSFFTPTSTFRTTFVTWWTCISKNLHN